MTAGDIIVINENSFGRKGNYYDGVDDYVLHDAHAVARVAAGDTVGTYTAWIYKDVIGGGGTILSAGDNNSTNEFLQLFFDSESKLFIKINHGGTTQFSVRTLNTEISPRTWTHIAIVQNGTRPTLYVNGKAVTMADSVSTDLTFWYDELTLADKFAIGVKESNATHTSDWTGAIGQVKYWSIALSDEQIKKEASGLSHITAEQTTLDAALQFNITYENDGTTDSGLGADSGTLVGGAIYGGEISDWSYKMNANVTGHAAEDMNIVVNGDRLLSVIKRGD